MNWGAGSRGRGTSGAAADVVAAAAAAATAAAVGASRRAPAAGRRRDHFVVLSPRGSSKGPAANQARVSGSSSSECGANTGSALDHPSGHWLSREWQRSTDRGRSRHRHRRREKKIAWRSCDDCCCRLCATATSRHSCLKAELSSKLKGETAAAAAQLTISRRKVQPLSPLFLLRLLSFLVACWLLLLAVVVTSASDDTSLNQRPETVTSSNNSNCGDSIPKTQLNVANGSQLPQLPLASGGANHSHHQRPVRTVAAPADSADLGSGSDDDGAVSVQTKHGIFRGIRLPDRRRRQPHWSPKETRPTLKTGDINDDANDDPVVAFLGIRYASAPIRRLRFMPPTAYHYAPNQIHNMQQFGPICRQRWPVELTVTSSTSGSSGNPAAGSSSAGGGNSDPGDEPQRPHSPANSTTSNWDLQMRLVKRVMPKESYTQLRPLFRRLAAREQSEDCLNLNIYTPLEAIATLDETGGGAGHHSSGGQLRHAPTVAASGQQRPPTLLPVLMIIHGESFDYGAGSAINGFKFVQQNRLLVVTFNYRLNILGFPPKLAGASRGNLGLMDQVAALHWVRDNIGSFGGSPGNVTLMGTKKGAIFVNLLMLSPLAKGLFQRALMEDGSALTPLVANHIISPTGSSSSLASSQPLASVQHVRLLARLCDCPAYQQQPPSPATPSERATSAAAAAAVNGSQAAASVAGQPQQHQLQQQQQHQLQQQPLAGFAFADETKTNALTFECLRHKPIEQIMQRVPLELLQQSPTTGEISISNRWLKPSSVQLDFDSARATSATETEHQRLAATAATSSGTLIPMATAADLVAVNGRQLTRLVAQVTRDRLERERAASLGSPLDIDNDDADDQLRAELFGAIYAQPSSTLRPLFGPVIDGTIVLDEEIATGMLRSGSSFPQRDLLIGLSHSAISVSSPPSSSSPDSITTTTIGDQPFELRPDHMLAERVTAQLQRTGLGNEQAVELVNLFVRSFYRYHNQEITNSIINHYLTSSRARAPLKQKPLGQSNTTTNSNRADGGGNNVDGGDTTTNNVISQRHQLLVLDSLLEAFQDVLTIVPVLKTALIHATKQLDSLVDAFVGQQFERWSNSWQHRGAQHATSPDFDQQDQLLHSFISFAQSLFMDSGWPLELHAPANTTVQQPRGTYLFQLDPSLLISEIKRLVEDLGSGGGKHSAGRRSVKEILSGLLVELQSPKFRHHLSFGCAFELIEDDDDNENYDQDLLRRFQQWTCSRFGSVLANFVATGNVNTIHRPSFSASSTEAVRQSLGDRLALYEENCSSLEHQRRSPQSDHHSVHVALGPPPVRSSGVSSPQKANTSEAICRHELNSMTFDYLVGALTAVDGLEPTKTTTTSGGSRWSVFNLFTQQIATLPGSKGQLWSMGQVVDSPGQLDQKSAFSARSSFWANFVPALNCTRTQPIVPSSLLLGSSSLAASSPAANQSSLLNLNLLFSCQHGAKTAQDVIESLVGSIKQQLQARINHWKMLTGSSRTHASQNHHALRMANMSQSGSSSSLDDQQQMDEQQLQSNNQSNTNGTEALLNGGQSQSPDLTGSVDPAGVDPTDSQRGARITTTSSSGFSVDLRTKYAGVALLACGLVLSLTLASGACAVMRKQRQRRCQQQEETSAAADDGNRRKSQPIGEQQPNRQQQHCDNSDGLQSLQQQRTSYIADETHDLAMVATNPMLSGDENQLAGSLAGGGQQNGQMALAVEESICNELMLNNEQQPVQDQGSNHVCTLGGPSQVAHREEIARSGFATGFWNGQDGQSAALACGGQPQPLNQHPISLCRSHSSLRLPADVELRATPVGLTTGATVNNSAELLCLENGQPIMVPILAKQPYVANQRTTGLATTTLGRRTTGCSRGNGGSQYFGSSTETQGQSSSLASMSMSKKRVKISDPLGAAKRAEGHQRAKSQLEQLRVDRAYCPVHQTPLTLGEPETTGYYGRESNNDGNFLTIASDVELWSGAHIDFSTMDHRPASIGSNCDRLSTSNTSNGTPQGFSSAPRSTHNQENWQGVTEMNGNAINNNQYGMETMGRNKVYSWTLESHDAHNLRRIDHAVVNNDDNDDDWRR